MKKRSKKRWTGPSRRHQFVTQNSEAEFISPETVAAVSPADMVLTDNELAPVLEGRSEHSLASAKTHWFFGEWDALATLDLNELSDHPDRDRFALLAASAHQQIGNHEQALSLIRLALEWGCPQRLVAQTLIAGVHNTLGRVSALMQDETRIEHHFRLAVAESKDTTLASYARSVREMARLGLLPQAVSLLDKELHGADLPTHRPQQQARLDILKTQVELLRSELALAQQRQQLFQAPKKNVAVQEASGGSEEGWLEDLRKRAVSQLGQELWVLERTAYRRDGFFVEFGATDGVLLSNTWLLEKEFGWKGICAEPNPQFFDQLSRNRRCIVSNACVGARTGEEVDFVLADEFGGMAKHAALDNNADRRSGYLADPRYSVKMRTISLNDLLESLGAPKHIDYLSIDTEGSELEILAAFPFSEWQIDLITVEHNFTSQRDQILRLLESNGYSRIEAQWDDWYYRSNLTFDRSPEHSIQVNQQTV